MAVQTQIETKKFRLADLEAAAYNPREISEPAMRGLRESLDDLGLLEMIVVNVKRDPPRVISGHQRRDVLMAAGVTHADCVVVHMDDAAEMSANLSMNNPAIRGTWDVRAALPVLDSVEAALPDPTAMGFESLAQDLRTQAARLDALAAPRAENAVGESSGPPKSEPGVVYTLGRHRLLCGDFRGLSSLVKKKATACITDPPYNVAYESASGETIEGDDQKPEEWSTFLKDLCELILRKTTGLCYVFMSSQEMPALERTWEASGGVAMRWLFWVKDRFTLGRGDYHHMHEPILHGAKEGATWYVPDTRRTNVLEFPKPTANDMHPTQKPVELIEALMLDATDARQIVLDPFVGSGTTLSVAEQLQRVCYAAELDPRYCDVTRRRWAEQVHGVGADWEELTPGTTLKT